MKPFKVLITGAGTTTAILVLRWLRGGQLVTRHHGRYAMELCLSLSCSQAQVGDLTVVLL